MGVIKTALEIALEKTQNVKSDKSSIELFEERQRGKKLANAFLDGQADLASEIKKAKSPQRENLKQGIFDVLVSQIALPSGKDDEKRIELVGKGLQAVIGGNSFSAMFKQLTQIFDQYLQEVSHFDKAIRQKYAPKLRQKEEELSQRLGREVRIDPLQDPEFIAFYSQNMNALRGNYETIVEQAKEEAHRLFNE